MSLPSANYAFSRFAPYYYSWVIGLALGAFLAFFYFVRWDTEVLGSLAPAITSGGTLVLLSRRTDDNSFRFWRRCTFAGATPWLGWILLISLLAPFQGMQAGMIHPLAFTPFVLLDASFGGLVGNIARFVIRRMR